MKIENFSNNHLVNIYTILNVESDIIYDDHFNVKNYIYNDKRIYLILESKIYKDQEFWRIKSVFEKIPTGWIKADSHFKMLNTIPQKVQIEKISNDNIINKFINHEVVYEEKKLYSKLFMTVFDNEVYFGLFSSGDFVGFALINELNFGEIKNISFDFKSNYSKIYLTPDLAQSYPFNNMNKTFKANSYFRTEQNSVFGFSFGRNNYWVDSEDISFNVESISKVQQVDKKRMIEEYFINTVRADRREYYTVNKQYETSSKINNIVSNFHENNVNPTLYKPFDYQIGIICDEFMFNSLKDSANIEYIPFSENIIINKKFDMIIVVSSWRGIDGSWQYVANPEGKKREILINMIKEYNKLNIPTIFYSKEDPVNYDRFISIAKNCKYIFTSAEEIIQKYKEETSNDNVDYLEFSINPKYHNPIGKDFQKEQLHKQVIFAGSWMKKYPTRNKESENIFDGVIESNKELNLIDRNFDRQLVDYQFPYKYIPYISKTLNHHELMKLHKATSWGINLNSVKYSNTMFANRVYELQAMGVQILSNYSMGVNNHFPYISMVHSKQDVLHILNHTSKQEQLEVISKGLSNVMLNHTAYHRISKILNTLGYHTEIRKPDILVVGQGKESRKSFQNQLYNNKFFVDKEEIDVVDINRYDFIAYFSEEYVYEENYLQNLLSGFAYTDASIVEMTNRNIYGYKSESNFDKSLSLVKITNKEKSNLIFNIPTTEILKNKIFLSNTKKLLSVIIPIHNNGRYLEDKCFKSLKKSTIFNDMEIIMIDDGSSDEVTLKIINRLRRRYPDIVYHRFESGSGSASRPRNKGIELASAEYLTFLDPDNEASGDGYQLLVKELQKNEALDLVLGNVIKEDNKKRSLLNYYYYVLTNNEGDEIVRNPKEFLIKANLRAHSIQALVVKTNIIKSNQLKMVEGAAGQDTMFFQELVLHSRNFKAVSDIIHIYYAAVTGSVTTTIKKVFFEKYLVLEKERVPFLKKHNLFDVYVNQRFPYYFVNWYCKRLGLVPENEYNEVHKIIKEILDLYIDKYDGRDKELNVYLKDLFDYQISVTHDEKGEVN